MNLFIKPRYFINYREFEIINIDLQVFNVILCGT